MKDSCTHYTVIYDAFRNEVYNKPKAFIISNVLTEGRKYEALTTGNELGMPKTERMFSINRSRKCGNCNTNYEPQQCPAYNDECSACGSRGHWTSCWRKTKHMGSQGKLCSCLLSDSILGYSIPILLMFCWFNFLNKKAVKELYERR